MISCTEIWTLPYDGKYHYNILLCKRFWFSVHAIIMWIYINNPITTRPLRKTCKNQTFNLYQNVYMCMQIDFPFVRWTFNRCTESTITHTGLKICHIVWTISTWKALLACRLKNLSHLSHNQTDQFFPLEKCHVREEKNLIEKCHAREEKTLDKPCIMAWKGTKHWLMYNNLIDCTTSRVLFFHLASAIVTWSLFQVLLFSGRLLVQTAAILVCKQHYS